MPKIATNNRINTFSSNGRVMQHEEWLDQNLRQNASPTFGNIRITGNQTIEGDLSVFGSTTFFNASITEFEDNLILINKNETSVGVTLGIAGFEIERGLLENYQFIFQESSQTFRVGEVGDTQPITTREENPLSNGVMVWNNIQNKLISQNQLDIDFAFNSSVSVGNNLFVKNGLYFENTSTLLIADSVGNLNLTSQNLNINSSVNISNATNAVNASTGSIYTNGGLGVEKDIYTNGGITLKTENTAGILVKTESSDIFNVNSLNSLTSFTSGVHINTNNTAGFIVQNYGVELLKLNAVNGVVNIRSVEESTGISSGAMIIDGGVSIGKNLNVMGVTKINNTLNANFNLITNLASPINEFDGVNKGYTDAFAMGIKVKTSVVVASTAPLDLTTGFVSGQIIDGYTLQTNDRILIKNQADPIENGIYSVQVAGSPLRVSDFDIGDSGIGVFTFVRFGEQRNFGFICNSLSSFDVVGTHPIYFTEFTGLNLSAAGLGLSKDITEFNVNVDDLSLEIFDDELRVKNTISGTGLTGGSGSPLQTTNDQSHVSKLGTIDTGIWQATTINTLYGGTGRTAFSTGTLLIGDSSNALQTNTNLTFIDNVLRVGSNNTVGITLDSNITGEFKSISLNSGGSINFVDLSDNSAKIKYDSSAETFDFTIKNTDQIILSLNENGISTNNIIASNLTTVNLISTDISTSSLVSVSSSIGNAFIRNLEIEDDFPVIGFNTATSLPLNTGILLTRRQLDNNNNSFFNTVVSEDLVVGPNGNGEVTEILTDGNLPLTQIRFTNTNTTNNFYIGWWIKTSTNIVRKIIAYSGGTRLATVSSPFLVAPTGTVSLYKNSFSTIEFKENEKHFAFKYSSGNPLQTTGNLLGIKAKQLIINDFFDGLNAGGGTSGIYCQSGVFIQSFLTSTSFTNGGALTVLGGGSISGQLYAGFGVKIGLNSSSASALLEINDDFRPSTMLLQNSTSSSIRFVKPGSSVGYALLSNNDTLSLTSATNGNTFGPSSFKALTIISSGNIGIHTTSGINNILTLKSGNFIATDSTGGTLGIASSTNSSLGSRLILQGNNVRVEGGNTDGNLEFYTNDIQRVKINESGITEFSGTNGSVNASTGSVILNGGLSIKNSDNATSFSSGGTITTNGGGSFNKDVYINGNLYLNGSVNFNNAVTNPDILGLFNLSNLLYDDFYFNTVLENVSGNITFSFSVQFNVINPNELSAFSFDLPLRITEVSETDVVGFVSGYSRETSFRYENINNLICLGEILSQRARISFQSNSAVTTMINVLVKYNRL